MRTRPGPGVITATRSPRKIASSTLWVMNITVSRDAHRDAAELLLQRHARLRVDGGERLVHQHHLRRVGERARDRDALLHAAGQLVRILVLDAVEVGEREEPPRRRRSAGPSPCRAA